MTTEGGGGAAGDDAPQASYPVQMATGGGGRKRVEEELKKLSQVGSVKHQRDKYNTGDGKALTTPEEAAAFLAAQRALVAKKEKVQPPKGLSSGDLDSWYLQQRARDAEVKRKRKEAEDMLRGYRMSHVGGPSSGGGLTDSSGVPSSSTTTQAVAHHHPAPDVVREYRLSPQSDEVESELALLKPKGASGVDNLVAAVPGDAEEVGTAGLADAEDTPLVEQTVEGGATGRAPAEEGGAEKAIDGSVEGKVEGGDDAIDENVDGCEGGGSGAEIEDSSPDHQDVDRDDRKEKAAAKTAIISPKRTENGEEKKAEEAIGESIENEGLGRVESSWRFIVSREEGARFPPESGRYHLYVAYACPWAHRTLMVRALKGLEDVISTTVVHPIWKRTNLDDPTDDHRGWIFGDPHGAPFTNTAGLGGPFPPAFSGNEPDPAYGAYSIRELYERANDTHGRYTVPILWDKKLKTIVSNESSEIIRMLNSEFNDFAAEPDLDLYPEDQRDKIDAVNDWVYPAINNGVYRCGFATTQLSYDRAIDELTSAFDRVDSILQKQRYIMGDNLTEADIRLFVTFLRFDEVYSVYFKANTRSVSMTPTILNYCREIYQMKGVTETCNMDQIKAHYYCSHVELNKFSIIPRGLGFMKLLSEPHDRSNI